MLPVRPPAAGTYGDLVPSSNEAHREEMVVMAHVGQVIENPVSGERIVFRQTAAETGGRLLEFDLFLRPDGKVPGSHRHSVIEERFAVLAGQMRFRLGIRTATAGPGDVVTVRCAQALNLRIDERFRIARRFFQQYDGERGAPILDFMSWEESSGRLDPNKPETRWWRTTNGEMMLDMQEADRLLESDQTRSDKPGVEKWIEYAQAVKKDQEDADVDNAWWGAHQVSLHEGIHMAQGYYRALEVTRPGEARFAETVVEDVDAAAIAKISTTSPISRWLLNRVTSNVYSQGIGTSPNYAARMAQVAAFGRIVAFLGDYSNIGMGSTRWDI
jgi:hypothetical protein